jgi:hypothetical protein
MTGIVQSVGAGQVAGLGTVICVKPQPLALVAVSVTSNPAGMFVTLLPFTVP